MTEYPDAETLTFDFELLSYAAHLWRISNSPLPPALEDILHRDKLWDGEVAIMKQAQDWQIEKRTGKDKK